jgi:hypothetical protein
MLHSIQTAIALYLSQRKDSARKFFDPVDGTGIPNGETGTFLLLKTPTIHLDLLDTRRVERENDAQFYAC